MRCWGAFAKIVISTRRFCAGSLSPRPTVQMRARSTPSPEMKLAADSARRIDRSHVGDGAPPREPV